MDTIKLDVARQKAGADYFKALEALGLRPDALLWAYDEQEARFVLVLATEMFDFKGPLAVSQLLFKAYNAAATPKEIDPFVVRLHSPKHVFIREVHRFKGFTIEQPGSGRAPEHFQDFTIDGVRLSNAWIYRFRLPPLKKPGELVRRWNTFSRNVERKAA